MLLGAPEFRIRCRLWVRGLLKKSLRSTTVGKWFQVYVWRDKPLLKEMLQRAADAQYDIMITVDTAVLGRRERDVRRGLIHLPKSD